MPYDYIKSPEAIYQKSFATIAGEARLNHLDEAQKTIAIRIAHSCGIIEAAEKVQFHPDFIPTVLRALIRSKPIYVDSEMTRFGIIKAKLKQNNDVICTLNDERTPKLAQKLGTTRSAAAIELWQELNEAIVVIGNAPTALFHLLEYIENHDISPSAIIGLPVGFVGAAESKEALMQCDIPWLSLAGRLGGSAMASSVINALASLTHD